MTQVYQIALGLFVLGVLVFIHELGHFIFAKLFKVKVLSFSLGFGKPLCAIKKGDTEYRIGSIPFGGYVHMAGEHPEDEKGAQGGEFTAKPVWQRACIAVAGPAFNYLSALLFLWITFVAGVQRPLYLDNTRIGAVEADSPAAYAGILPGDSLLSISATPVSSWTDVDKAFIRLSDTLQVQLLRADSLVTTQITALLPRGNELPRFHWGGMAAPVPAVVGMVSPGGPADNAGVVPGDSIIAINNHPVHSWQEMSTSIASFDTLDTILALHALRNGKPVVFELVPRYDPEEERLLVGIQMAKPAFRTQRFAPLQAVVLSWERAWDLVALTFNNLGKIISRQVSARQLAGPIGIVQMSGGVALMGLVPVLDFMALISINLALLNLLPFLIITDGGLLFFMLIEVIRGKPLSLRVQLAINRIALACIVAIFLYVTFNDIGRIPALFGIGAR